jgi:hypothetical protein
MFIATYLYLDTPASSLALTNPACRGDFASVMPSYRSPDQQVLRALFLDPCCCLISDAEIFRGPPDCRRTGSESWKILGVAV